ncbi:glycosyltransferase family 2 protein [Rhodoferax sp. GW822-FHT02A01]|uniref:glycosyltransferase family 2 protein n=1 Tax=Rhodoferax sp. GW822-FHT02A01 TaxID=3141537 RepID=UPI00315C9C13
MTHSIAIILPAYNEEVTIESVIIEFNAALPEAEIYVINNNSKDRTAEIARSTLSNIGCKGSVIDEFQQGKGNAMRRAFLDIDVDIYVLADADLTYPAGRVRDLIAPVLSGQADMVVGDRHSGGHYSEQNKRSLHGFGNELVKKMINMFFQSSLKDIMSGYRVFNRKFVKNYPILVAGFQIETELTLHALDKRFRIMELEIEYVDRPEGSYSKLNTIADGVKVIFTIFHIFRHYKPLRFYGFISLMMVITGVVSAIPVFHDWIAYRYIYHVPLAILATAFEIIAVVTISIGLILDSISHQEKMNYEMRLLSWRS